MHRLQALWLTLFATALSSPLANADSGARVTYGQVQKVFSAHCIACHDAKEADGELVLESFGLLMKGGENGAVIVPGKPDESLLVQQVEHARKPFMPPKKAKDTLSPDEIALIRSWVQGGAPGPAPGEIGVRPTTAVVVPRITPRVPRKSVRAICWSPQAKLAAVAIDGQVELVSVEDRSVVRRLHAERGQVNALAFSSDGMIVAAGAGEPGVSGEIDLWNVQDGSRVPQFQGHRDAVYSVALSPDGTSLASGGYDSQIIVWNLASGKMTRTLEGHNSAVLGLSFRPDGKVLASASSDRTVKLWDVNSGSRLDTFAESLKELNAVRFTADGSRLIAIGVDNRIREWQITPTAKEGTNRLLVAQFAHEGAGLALALSSSGKLLASAADDRTVKLWNPLATVESGAPELKMLRVLPAQSDWPVAIAFANDDQLLLVGRLDGTVGYYDPQSGLEVPPAKPRVSSVQPRGIQLGQTTRLEIHGKHLGGVTSVLTSNGLAAGNVVSEAGSTSDRIVIDLKCPPDMPIGAIEMKLSGAAGESNSIQLQVDDLRQLQEIEPNERLEDATPLPWPADLWGEFQRPGDVDYFWFDGKKGQTVVADVASQRIGSQAKVLLEVLDATGKMLASSNGFDGDSEPLLAFSPPQDAKFYLRLTEVEAAGSEAHFYRLSLSASGYVTGVFPLSVAAGQASTVHLLGLNLPPDGSLVVNAPSASQIDINPRISGYRTRRTLKVDAVGTPEALEIEPNDTPDHANPLPVPGSISGRIDKPGDVDLFRFQARVGRTYVVETLAAQRGSPVDTRVEVLHTDGAAVPRVVLRAVRDSAITFRGFDANAAGGRLQNWEEMDLNQYLYLSGEVVKLMLAPRGPDSEYGFFATGGKRQCYFDTTATAHALDEKCYIVEPHKPEETFAPNGLPVFTLNYANDDASDRKLGSDSRLLFTAPADGDYLVRVSDSRGNGGDRFVYRLTVRPAAPDFNVSIDLKNPAVPPGAGRNFNVNVDRIDGFEGPIRVEITGAPPGFIVSSPIEVEAGHSAAQGTIYAAPDAPAPPPASMLQTAIKAMAILDGKAVSKPVEGFGSITLAGPPLLRVGLDPVGAATQPAAEGQKPVEITVVPGQFSPARLWIKRLNFKDEVTFEADNLPHGVIVADIGLNGVLISENQSERQIFLHTAPWVAEQDRLCYVRALQAGNPTSMPILIHVRHGVQQARGKS